MSAAFFASTSLAAGFLVCGALFLAFAVVVGLFAKAPEPLREPV
jgi:hypothetical protein